MSSWMAQAKATSLPREAPLSEARYVAEHNTILRATVGSTVHGLALDGTDDHDEMGIAVEPPEFIMGLRDFEQWVYRSKPEGVRSGRGDLDLTIYGLRKWTRLAAKGNPSILVLLFAPVTACSVLDGFGAELRAHSKYFASMIAVRKFLGYMVAQKERLLGERGQMRVHRPELIERHGYDTKYAMHALRLGYQGIEFARTGRVTLPMPDSERLGVMEVRRGERTIEEVTEMYEAIESTLEEELRDPKLPMEPNWHAINQFLIDLYVRYWGLRFRGKVCSKP